MTTTVTFPNANAQRHFDAAVESGRVPASAARAIRQEARYIMNNVGGRYSDAVYSALQYFPNFTSPMATAIWADES